MYLVLIRELCFVCNIECSAAARLDKDEVGLVSSAIIIGKDFEGDD
jgi:hypothetical protein